MVAVEQNASFAFIVEVGPEIDSTNDMPASFEFFFKTFFDVFGCVLEVSYFVFDHLDVYVLCDKQSVLFHIYFHVAELYIDCNLQVA